MAGDATKFHTQMEFPKSSQELYLSLVEHPDTSHAQGLHRH